jgi:hypothetical protein
MQICSDGHDEVVYQGKDCPVCPLVKDIADLESALEEKKQEVQEMSGHVWGI